MTLVMIRRILTLAGAAGLTLLAACGSSSSTSASGASTSAPPASAPAAPASSAAARPTPSAASAAVLKTDQTSLGTVLTNAGGFTVYFFARDNATSSACSAACAAAWPPVIGIPHAASGVKLTGKLGEIRRSDGSMQATYDGHPLYLFAGDAKPGQVNGNAVDGFGALWYAIKIGSPVTTGTTTSGTSGTSGGGTSGSSGSMSGSTSGGGMSGSGSGSTSGGMSGSGSGSTSGGGSMSGSGGGGGW
jgi:predicted lipoprotein with Yx(FWY)xxD motif